MIDIADVHEVVGKWWWNYDAGNFDLLAGMLTDDVHFACRTDTGTTPYEAFVRADIRGRDAVMAWQTDHRLHSPYPLRHNGTNVHVTQRRDDEADFRSYIFVTQIAGGAVSNLSSGLCLGRVRIEDGSVRIAELRVVLDVSDSELFSAAERQQPA